VSWQSAQIELRKSGARWRPPEWPQLSYLIKHLAITGTIALALGLSGAVWPGHLLPIVPRTALWVGTSLLTAFEWILAIWLMRPLFNAFRLPAVVMQLAVPPALVPLCAAEYAFAAKAFGLLRDMPFDRATFLFGLIFLRNAYLVGFPILLVVLWCTKHPAARPSVIAPSPTPATTEAATPGEACADRKLLSLLPAAVRAPIIALKAEDHYVRIYTERGNALVLMRFADALAHVEQMRGLRIHRSYWASEASITKLVRNGRRSELHLAGGLVLPISRAHEHEVAARIGSAKEPAAL